jgi:hypothetical protein
MLGFRLRGLAGLAAAALATSAGTPYPLSAGKLIPAVIKPALVPSKSCRD